MPNEAVTEKASADVTVMTLLTAIVGAIGAFAIFQPKFAISAAMRRETGSVESAFRLLYVFPQIFNALVIAVLCLLLMVAFVYSMRPDLFSHTKLLVEVGAFFVVGNIIWILFLAAFIAAIVQFNWLSWILLLATDAVSFIPGLQGTFGRHGQSAGWHQAWNICWAWDKGHPLLLSQDEIDRVANDALRLLTLPTSGAKNFAPTPANASIDARANIALFGCILEATHYAQHWTSPSWAEFYAGLAAIHYRTKMFDPKKLLNYKKGSDFAQQLRNELVAEINSRKQPVPADSYLAAMNDLSLTWNGLQQYSGNVLNLIPLGARFLGGRLYWLDRRLSQLPKLNSEGMRPQLIKLLARWQTLPWIKAGVFVQPFAKKLGWLLLQEGALHVLPEQTDVTFFDVGDVPLTRIACLRVFRSVENTVRGGQSSEAVAIGAAYPGQWDLFAAADFTLWNWASESEEKGRSEQWDGKKGWRWSFDNGRASKVG